VRRNPNLENSDSDISFWFAALNPLLGVALGLAAAAVIEML
jgi:hypothetical protein